MRITFRMPLTLQEAMNRAVLETPGYGSKGKSRWIREAIEELLKDKTLASVGAGEKLVRNEAAELVRMPVELKDRIAHAAGIIRRQDPFMDGVQSAIIRAAIRTRLDRERIG